jgi:hypothetical protein
LGGEIGVVREKDIVVLYLGLFRDWEEEGIL